MYQQKKNIHKNVKAKDEEEGLVFTTEDIFFGVTGFIKSQRLTLGALLSLFFVESKNDRNNLMFIDGQNV